MPTSSNVTAVVPYGSVSLASGRPLFSDIQKAFPGIAGGASNLISGYFARHPMLAPSNALVIDPLIVQSIAKSNVVGAEPATQFFSRFMGLTALTPTFGALSNVRISPDLEAFALPLSGTNAVFLAGGILTALVGGNAAYAASLTVNLIDYLDNRRFHLGTGVCTFAVDATTANPLPANAVNITSSSLGTLALSTNSVTAYNVPVVLRCTNFYKNWGTFTITHNLVPAPYVAGPTAVYVGESFCPVTGLWADASGNGRTATVSSGTATQAWTLNGRAIVTGSTGTAITFPAGVLPSSSYTILHIGKYSSAAGARNRILTSSDGANWLSGHYSGKSGVAFHGGWLTSSTLDRVGATWVLSSDQLNLYRANGMALGTSGAASPGWCQLGINTYLTEKSDFSVAYLAVYPIVLTSTQILEAERALAQQYNLAWSATGIAGNESSPLTTNTYLVDLSTIFKNCTVYAVGAPPGYTANPQASASVSGSTVTVTGANRNTSYTVWVSGSASSTGSTTFQSFTIYEYQQPPTSSAIGQRVYWTGNTTTDDFDVSRYFSANNGSSVSYSVRGDNNPTNNGSVISYTPAERNNVYKIYVTLTTQYTYNSNHPLSTSQTITIVEYQQSPTKSKTLGTQTLDSELSTDITLTEYFNSNNGSGAKYTIQSTGVGNHPGLSITSTTLTITAKYRNATYTRVQIRLSTTDSTNSNPLYIDQFFDIIEYQRAPTFSPIPTQNLGTGLTVINLDNYIDFKGASFYMISLDKYYDALTLSKNTIQINAAYRNTTYNVTVTVETTDSTGVKTKSISQAFSVIESAPPYWHHEYSFSWTTGDDQEGRAVCEGISSISEDAAIAAIEASLSHKQTPWGGSWRDFNFIKLPGSYMSTDGNYQFRPELTMTPLEAESEPGVIYNMQGWPKPDGSLGSRIWLARAGGVQGDFNKHNFSRL